MTICFPTVVSGELGMPAGKRVVMVWGVECQNDSTWKLLSILKNAFERRSLVKKKRKNRWLVTMRDKTSADVCVYDVSADERALTYVSAPPPASHWSVLQWYP